jgi:hypothetical protein
LVNLYVKNHKIKVTNTGEGHMKDNMQKWQVCFQNANEADQTEETQSQTIHLASCKQYSTCQSKKDIIYSPRFLSL